MGGTTAVLQLEEGGEFALQRLAARERLSSCFRIDASSALPIGFDAHGLLGKSARIELHAGGMTRTFWGFLSRVQRGAATTDGHTVVRVRLEPHLRRLVHRRASRIFQDVSTSAIVEQILAEHRIGIEADTRRKEALREYCVQHEETDLEFVERLLAEEGFAYYFKPPTNGRLEIVAILDRPAYPDLEAGMRLRYRPLAGDATALRREENDVASFELVERVVPRRMLARAFDFHHPRRIETASASADGGEQIAEVREDHGPYGEMQVELQQPEVLLDQVRRDCERFHGASECARLHAGAGVSVEDHDHPTLNGAYGVTAVRHELRPADGGKSSYANRFETVRRAVLLRPKRPRRRVRQSHETAIVVGPDHEEVHTDALGRVRVQFHWDVGRAAPGANSCWIRVAQSWAGAGFGSQFIPRVGMEVLVAYLGGDPDRPMIVGCVPKAVNPPAFPLPASKTRSGFRTLSSPRDTRGNASPRCRATRTLTTEWGSGFGAGVTVAQIVAHRTRTPAEARGKVETADLALGRRKPVLPRKRAISRS